MEPDSVHELTAAYALDALPPDEAEAYEAHLAGCASCREELAALGDAASALAHGVVAPTPPAELRERILQAAAADRPNVVPLRLRRPVQALAAVAAATAAVAVGLGLWASSLHDSLQRERSAGRQLRAAAQVLGQPDARRVALSGRQGALYITSSGEGALVLTRLPRAPKGRIYEAWVIQKGTPAPAGLFEGGGELTALRLRRPVPAGAAVAVTIESAGGARAPQGPRIANVLA